MATPHRISEAETDVPSADEQGQLLDLVAALTRRGATVSPQPAIATDDGARHELTPGVADVLVQVAGALADGQGVTLAPQQRLLTTQEAADLLNVSQPTLVKRLEAGELPYAMRGRHRRIRLTELLNYQERLRSQRAAALRRMEPQSQDGGLYDLLDSPPAITGQRE